MIKIALIFLVTFFGYKYANDISNENSSFITVTIGKQIWMKENLNVDKFRNGDVIKEAKTLEEWNHAGLMKQPAWCYYNNQYENGLKYGKLYNYYAVQDPRGLAPVGYHIANEKDWKELESFLGDESAVLKMKNSTGWQYNGNGNNISGFSALPGGCRQFGGEFYSEGLKCFFWIYYPIQSGPNDNLIARKLSHDYNGYLDLIWGFKMEDGLSVRCVKDIK
jgi:uncharacterized protein (TIGR02145 family)